MAVVVPLCRHRRSPLAASVIQNALWDGSRPAPGAGHHGDVLGNEGAGAGAAQQPDAYSVSAMPGAVPAAVRGSQKLEQQRLVSQQKRLQRSLNYGVATSNANMRLNATSATMPPASPASAIGEDYRRPGGAAVGGGGGGGYGSGMYGGGGAASTPPARAGGGYGGSAASDQDALRGGVAAMSLTYDPEADEPGSVIAVGSAAAAGSPNASPAPVPQRMEITDLRSFAFLPGPKAGPLLCKIMRDKATGRYTLYSEEGNRFLMSAFKRKKAKTAYYAIYSDDSATGGREDPAFLAKLRANFVGTEFEIYDSGDKGRAGGGRRRRGKKGDDDGEGEDGEEQRGGSRKELGAVLYQYNVLGTRGPRKMTGIIPAVDGSGCSVYRPSSADDTMVARVKGNVGTDELVVMRNKPPRWNSELNAYCLNFNGRVTEASVKNFQLVTDDNHNYVILQFGKCGDATFTMDYRWPMSALQAFAICLTSFDHKLACE